MTRIVLTVALAGLFAAPALAAPVKSAKEALKPLHDLVGEWKGTGGPKHGSRDEREKGAWQEQIVWKCSSRAATPGCGPISPRASTTSRWRSAPRATATS